MRRTFAQSSIEKVQLELADLDRDFVSIRGKRVKPSQCYRFDADTGNILYNTYCPDGLKKKLQEILGRHLTPPND